MSRLQKLFAAEGEDGCAVYDKRLNHLLQTTPSHSIVCMGEKHKTTEVLTVLLPKGLLFISNTLLKQTEFTKFWCGWGLMRLVRLFFFCFFYVCFFFGGGGRC